MTINSNSVRVWSSDGTITPTAPLIEGSAPTTYHTNTGSGADGPGFSHSSYTGRRGCRVTFAAALDLSTHDYVQFVHSSNVFNCADRLDTFANGGLRVIFVDGSGNYAGFSGYHRTADLPGYKQGTGEGWWNSFPASGRVNQWYVRRGRTPNIASGTINWANITAIEFSVNNTSNYDANIGFNAISKTNKISVTGTETLTTVSELAANRSDNLEFFGFTKALIYMLSAAQAVYTTKLGLAVGNGSTATNLTDSNFSLGFENVVENWPTYAYNGPYVLVNPASLDRYFDVNQSASCVLSLTDGSMSSSGHWGYRLQGSASGSANVTRVSFVRFAEFAAAHGTYTSCTWNAGSVPVVVTAATVINSGTVINATTTGMRIAGAAGTYPMTCSFANPTATADIELGSGGAGTYTLGNISVAGGYTLKIRNNSATNSIIVEVPAGITTSTTTAGGSITVSSPPVTRGLAFTSLVAGSQVVVYDTGTTTERFRTNSSGTSETWSETVAGSRTVDYTIQLAGRLPIRVAGVTVTGALSGGVLATPVQQALDRSYTASTGLTFGTTGTVNTGTSRFTVTTATTVQNWYSFMVESWIAQSALRNRAFPISSNGPNSFTLEGWEFSSGINFLSRDGLRYTASGVATMIYAALYSVDTAAGLQIRYQQTDGGTTTNAATTGPIDQLIQVFGDATHGNFDRRNWLTLKVQKDGFDQAETNAIATYGNLEDQLYVIGLNPLANGLPTGAPTVNGSPTITDHGASPVTWNTKQFSITITDSAAGNTGATLMRWIRFNLDAGGTFQGKPAFNWHDLVQVNGTSFRTVRGAVYGDTGAALKGVRVVMSDGVTPHPGFNLHTADDGTTFAPVFPAAATATVLADTRVQLFNVTTGLELNTSFVTGTAYSFVVSSGVTVGDTLRLRACKKGRAEAQSFAVWASAGATFLLSQPIEPNYAAWGVDGATCTEYSLDGPNIQIDANDVDGFTQKTRLGAFYNHALTLEVGIRTFFGAMTFLGPGSIRINADVVNLRIDNINATTALVFTDVNVRLFRSDGSSIIAPTSYTIHSDYSGEPFTVETGVSGLTGAESAQLLALPSASTTADTVWSYASRTLTASTSTAFLTPLAFKVSTTTTASDPGPGHMRWNSATQSAATEIYLDTLTDDNTDIANYIDLIPVGSQLYVQDKDVASNVQKWLITSIAHQTGWSTFGVSPLSFSGGNLPNNHAVVVLFNNQIAGALSTEQSTQLAELHRIHGLQLGAPLTVTQTSRQVSGINQTLSSDEVTTTVSRT